MMYSADAAVEEVEEFETITVTTTVTYTTYTTTFDDGSAPVVTTVKTTTTNTNGEISVNEEVFKTESEEEHAASQALEADAVEEEIIASEPRDIEM